MERALLDWFETNGRDLPWRDTTDAYAILVSEVMLQQTQVPRVVPMFEVWLERWPTVETLAEAPRAEVIKAWQGLGYNRRAVNLHLAVIQITRSGWPDDLTRLPGVGRYTADAVARFAHGESVLPVDVNVRRIQSRTGHEFTHETAAALMDLGAMICLARVPRCTMCPLSDTCPSSGSQFEPERKQSPFEGSFRQRRSKALREISESAKPVALLDGEAVRALERDGLTIVEEGVARLPR